MPNIRSTRAARKKVEEGHVRNHKATRQRIKPSAQDIAGDEAHSPGKDSLAPASGSKPATRTKARMTEPRKKRHMASATLSDKQTGATVKGKLELTENGVEVSSFLAETVPVGDYANVVVGPVGMRWILSSVRMEDLIDVDWGDLEEDDDETLGQSTFDYDAMTDAQKAAYDRAYGALRATMKVTGHVVSEDRETIERSIRLYHLREIAEAEAAAASKKSTSRARTRAKK